MSFAPLAAAASFINTSQAVDVIGVYDQNFNQVFKNARPMKAVIKPAYQNMTQPLETGAVTTDHRIILPVEIELSVVIQGTDYKNTYQIIKNYAQNGTLLIVQTKTDIYRNQIFIERFHEESADMLNTVAMAIKMIEVLIVSTQITTVPKNPTDSSTVNRGNVQSSTPNQNQQNETSALYSTFKPVLGY
jgi:hypothetical protein